MHPRPAQPGNHADDATLLMAAAASGDRAAADRLLPLVYDQLRRAAQLQMNAERSNHTLSATALVHEAYLKLAGPRDIPWANRAHFYAAAAESMRRILLDHARSRARKPAARVALTEIGDVADLASADASQILALDEALARLETDDAQAANIVRLRFYAGLSVDQAAEALGLSPRTAARLWNYARAVPYRALSQPT
jgi:RNA polymerase sigma factor (TIGR02999 family)